DDRQVCDAAQERKHAEVERVAGERLERADAAFAKDDVAVAARDDVLGGHEPLLDGRGQAALQHHRFAQLADPLEKREVLHVASTRSRVSTEQGPAMTQNEPPPIFTPRTSTTVASGLISRLTSLYGCEMGTASATPSKRVKSEGSSGPRLPVTQMAVRCAPG